MTRQLILIAAAAVLVPAVSGASDDWDTNSDGVVTRAEAEAAALERARERFDTLDADKDGRLTKQEIDAARGKRHAAMREHAEERFKAADSDGDGRLSKAEAEMAMPRLAARFDDLDADKDGALTTEELAAQKRKPPR